jgi:hypothetical protein
MSKIIFGIGPNPMLEEFEDEEGDYKISPFNVFISDKKTWVEKGHCSDDAVDQKMRKKLEKAGFAESMDSVFEPLDKDMTKEQIHQAIEGLGYEYNQEFGDFMESAFG